MENVLFDIPRLYTAIAEWAACMVYLLNMKKRFVGKTFRVYRIGRSFHPEFLSCRDRKCGYYLVDSLYGYSRCVNDRLYLVLS